MAELPDQSIETRTDGRTPEQLEAAVRGWDEIENAVDGFDRFGDDTEPTEDELIMIGRLAWDVHCRDQGYR